MRKDTGELKGEILVNGKELPVSFQRTTGTSAYVMLRLLLIDGQAIVNKWTYTSRKLLSEKLWNSLRC